MIELIKSIARLGLDANIPKEGSSCEYDNDVTQPFVIPPHNTKIQTVETNLGDFKPDDIKAVKNGSKYFWFCGQVVYVTLGKDYTFPLCSYSTGDLALFRECKK